MPYQERPGWLTEIINNALGTYQQFRGAKENRLERERAENQREFERKQTKATMASNLATTGQLGLPEQQAAIGELIPGIKLGGETPLQSRSRILKMPEKTSLIPKLAKAPMFGEAQREPTASLGETTTIPGQDTVSDEQLRIAGLETGDEKRAKRLQSTIVDIQTAALGGQLPGSEAAAGLAGVMTASGEQLKRLTQYQPVLDNAAKNFVSGVINKKGGRIDSRNMGKIAGEAYNEFLGSNIAKIPPELDSMARTYFESALRDEYITQRKLDIEQIAASMRYQVNGVNNESRQFGLLDQAVRTQADIVKMMTTGATGSIVKILAGKPDNEVDPSFKDQVTKYRAAVMQLNQSINARNALGASVGMNPTTMSELLGDGGVVPDPNTASSSKNAQLHAQAAQALGYARTEGARKAILNEYKRITGEDYK